MLQCADTSHAPSAQQAGCRQWHAIGPCGKRFPEEEKKKEEGVHFSATPRNSFMPRIRCASSSDAAPVTLRSVQLDALSASFPLSSRLFLACGDTHLGSVTHLTNHSHQATHRVRHGGGLGLPGLVLAAFLERPPARPVLHKLHRHRQRAHAEQGGANQRQGRLGHGHLGASKAVSRVLFSQGLPQRGRLQTPVGRRSMLCGAFMLERSGDRGRWRAGRPPLGADSSEPCFVAVQDTRRRTHQHGDRGSQAGGRQHDGAPLHLAGGLLEQGGGVHSAARNNRPPAPLHSVSQRRSAKHRAAAQAQRAWSKRRVAAGRAAAQGHSHGLPLA